MRNFKKTQLAKVAVTLVFTAAWAHSVWAATIYTGGDILTMHGSEPQYVEALVSSHGKITFLGSKSAAEKMAGKHAERVDLKGQTLLPGFIDAHGHLIYAAHSMQDANLAGVKNISELLQRLKTHASSNPDGRLVGLGYRAEQLDEKRHPTREELDSVSATRQIVVSDGSGHQGVINSVVIKDLKIGPDTPDPEGGFYTRKPGSKELTGHVAESALMDILSTRQPLTTGQIKKGVDMAVQLWLANGQTTLCEMGLGLSGDDVKIARTIIDKKLLPVDLILFAKAARSKEIFDAAYLVKQQYQSNKDIAPSLLEKRPDVDKRYVNRVRLAGYKFWIDGSADTALMSKPYSVLPPGVTDKNYVGIRNDPQDVLEKIVAQNWRSGLQVAAHAIGDEAVDQFIVAMEKAKLKYGPADARPIIQHAQFIRDDQISRIKAVGAITSFTAGGIYPMGDYVSSMMGAERSLWMGRAKSVQDAGINWTVNHDNPAGVSPSLLYAVWGIVNRTTKTTVMAPNEVVSAYDGMKSITINAAKQYKEEKNKGSLKVGKLADLVILDKNPIKVPPQEIKNIQVMQTIKEGKVVYTKSAQAIAEIPELQEENEAMHSPQTQKAYSKEDLATLRLLEKSAIR